MNNFAIKKPINPHPGKVSTQVSTMSRTIFQRIDDTRFAAPTPMIAVVFMCVVLTGIPNQDEHNNPMVAAISEANP